MLFRSPGSGFFTATTEIYTVTNTLSLHDALPISCTVARNDDWSASHWTTELTAAAATVQAFALPENSLDAALVVQLPPGNYTFQIAAKGSTSGTVLGEAYELP